MKILIILNDPPYGNERSYNGLRLAHALTKAAADAQITIFLMADAVICARKGQKTPDGFYHIERMVQRVWAGKGSVIVCGTCLDARGIDQSELTEGAQRSTINELAAATPQRTGLGFLIALACAGP